jgi:predicted HTH domain antitoxin
MNQQPKISIFSKPGLSKEKSQWCNNFGNILEILLKRLNHQELLLEKSDDPDQFTNAIEHATCILLLIDNELIKDDVYASLLQKSMSKDEKLKEKVFAITTDQEPDQIMTGIYANLVAYDFTDIPAGEHEIHQILRLNHSGNETLLKFVDLAYDIAKIINRQKAEKQTVYLAEVTKDQTRNRNILKRELLEYGYEVIPKTSLPQKPDEYKKAVTEFLKQSVLAIHIIGNQYGTPFSDQGNSKPEYQHKIASDFINETPNHALSRLLWVPTNIKATNEKQEIFIGQLKRDIDSLKNADIIQTPIEEFKSIIKQRIITAQNAPSQDTVESEKKSSIYLIYEKKDTDKTAKIKKVLEELGFEILETVYEGVQNLVEAHRKNLIQCNGVMIYYSSENEFWLSSKLKDILKAPGYGRTEPFTLQAVYTENNIDITNNYIQDLLTIKGKGEISKSDFEPILEKMKVHV